ncbi:Rpn family recombination-promoting nuclease/putative transposase [Crassaminicella profunda]|uniref:Rpn family recombination-promoting nuclease/putative transposase n=1 Tax=Crassaminicella profunda TaxID=1286698 RepID=UPI001CA7AB1E|nr:Rpn family recombination-promoting nuclease/putative transposase [Crassaminicella profunda]QZY53889.1 Rpn family recombination-promoting nuclease/putative transposase [Crassaminicella profunda]
MKDKIKHEHDLGYKEILSHKKTFLEFLRSFVKKDWVKLIDEENLILIDKEFILKDFKQEEADIVYKVNIDGKDIIFYVLLELQSKVDYRMPIRLLMYMTEIWREELTNTEDKVKKRKDYRLPVIVPIVLYNGKNKWTAARNFKEILNGYELFEENIIDFRYMLFDVNRMKEEELLEIANLVSSIFLLDQDVAIEEILKRLKLIGRILGKKGSKEQIQIFNRWMMNVFKKRFDERIGEHVYQALEKTNHMEVEEMISNLGRKIEEEFKHREEKGIQKGKMETAKNLLLMGIDIPTIIKATGLSNDDIEKIKSEMN